MLVTVGLWILGAGALALVLECLGAATVLSVIAIVLIRSA